jgi:hypothetical protein
MALQPNIQIINQAALDITAELAKFPNIPALDQGNAILDYILIRRQIIDITS